MNDINALISLIFFLRYNLEVFQMKAVLTGFAILPLLLLNQFSRCRLLRTGMNCKQSLAIFRLFKFCLKYAIFLKKICPFGAAWSDQATATDTAHNSAECSNRGICDRSTGNNYYDRN